QTSEEWLRTHSIEFQKLTLQDLVDKGKIGRLHPDKQTGKVNQHIQFDGMDVNEFEYRINTAIEQYTKRIKWLLQGSKRVFGNVGGKNIGICIDASEVSMGYGRLTALKESLIHLIDEQLSKKSSMYVLTFGSDIDPLWPVVRDINDRVTEDAKEWVMRLGPSGGCNALKAIQKVMKLKDLDMILFILGSVPDQATEKLCDFTHQLGVGRHMPIHCVAYDCSDHLTNVTLRNMAETSRGKYHCYTANCEIYSGTDISLLLKEIHRCQDILGKIKEMRQGMMGTALISIMNEITAEVAKLPQSRFLPRPPGHEDPLRIEIPKFHIRGSRDWLKQHGLKAKRLHLYQVLAPNAYAFKEEYIPIINKAVQSQVHEKAMVQFPWHDGSIKNIHVNMSQLFEYQKQLKAAVSLFERRVDWLASGSRRIFGTITEKNVVILIDTSVSNINYLVHMQHSIRLLMEQQIGNKEYFNIITFGSESKAWRPTMVKPTLENLQDAWKFVLDIQCGGSRNFLSAYRRAVENDDEIKHHINVQGIYLFTSGVPDQTQDVAGAYIEEMNCGRHIKLHSILFNVDDYNAEGAIPGRYANITRTAECLRNLAHCSTGRFHWFRETGIIESDDIQDINTEIDKALNFSSKCAMLVESVKRKYKDRFVSYTSTYKIGKIKALPQPPSFKMRALPPSPYKPRIEDTPGRDRPLSAKDPMQRVRSSSGHRRTASSSHFFIDDKKNNIGTVIDKIPSQKSIRKAFVRPIIPELDDNVSTKQWMRLYSLGKLKLDLNRFVSGPDCKHVEKSVKTLNKPVSAKYCHIFPSVNIRGTIKHLQLLPHEMEDYETNIEKVLCRYLKRLQWLLSGSRRVFGTIVHKRCVFLVDTSGSMMSRMEELKKEMAALVWEQLNKHNIQFNLISFSGNCETWRDCIQVANEENCHDAVEWASVLTAEGNTCTLEALQLAFDDPDIEAIYMLTDGKPDTSTSLVLREVMAMNEERNIPVNTISFNCSDSTANSFLQLLANETGGRYHRCPPNFDAQLFAHKLLSEGLGDTEYPHLPQFEGDDLQRLGAEISLARKYLAQSRSFR
ncbi:hypothetical protein LOTGIDRAFT_107324, partial [Lottia gigantea]